MTPPADTAAIRDLFARAERRVTLILAVYGATTGFVVAVMISAVIWLRHGAFSPPGAGSLALVALGIIVGIARGRMQHARIAVIVETRAPELSYLLVTAS